MSHSSFSVPFIQLVHRLRLTNARYAHIAYLCRGIHRPTYHAKRRACRAGLRIDTSKASNLSSPPPITLVLETNEYDAREADDGALQLAGGDLPQVAEPKGSEIGVCLSPIELDPGMGIGLNASVGDAGGYNLPIYGAAPGAPRLRPRPLPEEITPIQHVYCPTQNRSDASQEALVPFDACVGLGITVPRRRLKRRVRDFDMDACHAPRLVGRPRLD